MNLEELMKLKYELNKKLQDLQNSKEDKLTIKKKIENELAKIDKIIAIYQIQDQNYIIMKLERLYMMLLSKLDEEQFNLLSEDELFEIFDKYFPDEWVYKYNDDLKEKLLIKSILKNEIINYQEGNIN